MSEGVRLRSTEILEAVATKSGDKDSPIRHAALEVSHKQLAILDGIFQALARRVGRRYLE